MKHIIEGAILSYPKFAEPEAFGGGDPKYSCTLVMEENGADHKALKTIVAQLGRERYGDKFAALIKAGKVKLPFHRSTPEDGYPEGTIYIRVRTKSQPGMVAIWRGSDGKAAPLTADKFYAGCVVNASVMGFTYDNESKGISFALNNVQFVSDGERLDGRVAAQDEFDVDEDAVAPLEDLKPQDDPNADEDADAGDPIDDLLG